MVEAAQTVTVEEGMPQNKSYSRSTNLNRAAKADAVNKITTGGIISSSSRSSEGNKMGRSYYLHHVKALVGKQLKVWYPDETGTSGAHWDGYVKSYCGRKRWHVVFDDGSYTRALSLDQILESIVVSYFSQPCWIKIHNYSELCGVRAMMMTLKKRKSVTTRILAMLMTPRKIMCMTLWRKGRKKMRGTTTITTTKIKGSVCGAGGAVVLIFLILSYGTHKNQSKTTS